MTDFAARARAALEAKNISMRSAARALNYDPAYLSRVLNGKQPPSRQLAKSLDQLLGLEGALSALAVVLTLDDRARLRRSIAAPSRVDAATVGALAEVLAAQRRLEDALGPAVMIPATVAKFDTIKAMAKDARGPHRRGLVDVAAQWATFTGWLHAAVGAHRPAKDRFNEAADFAAEAGNNSLASTILAFKAYAAGKRGEDAAKEGLTAAARKVPNVHPAQEAYNAFQHARAFADLGESDEGARLLDEAAGLVCTAASEGNPPPWAYWYTPAFFKLNIGLTQARLGRADVAADMITAGLHELPSDQQASEWVGEFRDALNEVR